MDFAQLRDEALLAARRFFRTDFQIQKATDVEREQLAQASPPVTPALAQDFAAWRRSLLWAAGVAFGLLTVLSLASFTTMETRIRDMYEGEGVGGQAAGLIAQLGKQNLAALDDIALTLILPYGFASVMAILAALAWTRTRRSRRLARYGYLVMFLTPFVVAIFPLNSWFMGFDHLGTNDAARKAVQTTFGSYAAGMLFMILGPRSLALFPAIIRSSMGLKTLVPESPLPGWVATILAPLYGIFLIVLFSLVNQANGNLFLVVGTLCFLASTLVYLYKAGEILRPRRDDEISAVVAELRRMSSIFVGVGAVSLGIFLLTVDAFGIWDALKFLFSVSGNVLLLSVVSSDFVLAMLHAGHQQTAQFQGTELAAQLDAKFRALEGVGFTDLRTREPGGDGGASRPAAEA